MNNLIPNGASPLSVIDTSFVNYVASRKVAEQRHMNGGNPDYAFPLDHELKQRLSALPHFEQICRSITSTFVTQEIQSLNRVALAVGPEQFPDIYQMGVDCAKRLGIGVPNIFILDNVEINAYTIASDDVSPIVVIYSGMVERVTPGELKFFIGHECGHIHNNHGVYRTVINALFNGFGKGLGALVSVAGKTLMTQWTRACEVTADRAGMICADSVEDSINAMSKTLYGALLNNSAQVNIEALRAQLEETYSNPSKILEIASSHPSGVRRVFLQKEFEECELLYDWRPEFKKPETVMRSKEETDERSKKICAIFNNELRR